MKYRGMPAVQKEDTEVLKAQSLPSSTPVLDWGAKKSIDTIEKELRDASAASTEYALLLGVSPEDINNPDSSCNTLLSTLSHSLDYDLENERLTIKMRHAPHQAVSTYFTYYLLRIAEEIGIDDEISAKGQACRKLPIEGHVKEPDMSVYVVGHGDWPALVGEVGYIDSSTKTARDAMRWLTNSRGGVKIAIAFDVDREAQSLRISSYKYDGDYGRGGAVLTQRVELKHPLPDDDSGAAQFVVPFEDLMSRPPREGTGEGDLVMTSWMMKKLLRYIFL
ncbi:hypothetical protein KEM55_002416 [Ascosphaera atra]|nr:hypothetical protein KEM55_002416 [Ascosphaera atra]